MYKKTVASKLEAYVKCAWRDACENPESCPLYPGVAGEDGCGDAGLRAIEEAVEILKEAEPVKPETANKATDLQPEKAGEAEPQPAEAGDGQQQETESAGEAETPDSESVTAEQLPFLDTWESEAKRND